MINMVADGPLSPEDLDESAEADLRDEIGQHDENGGKRAEEEVRLDGEEAADHDVEAAQRAIPMCQPCVPSQADVDEHNLTHLPYRSWCPWCVAARKPNTPHSTLPSFSREIPLLVADYCFLRDKVDQDLLTVLVARLYPSRAVVAIPCDAKGVDEYAVSRLAAFLNKCGVERLVYMSDKESSLRAMLEASMNAMKATGTYVSPVPEESSTGESQSNGRAERTVQSVEDHLRTMKGALEHRIAARIPSQHPVMKWMTEYTAVLMCKYAVHATGKTSYQELHGKRAREKLAEFGERVFYFVPKRRRAKLDLRWELGIYLGTTMHSNEVNIGLKSGNVTRARAISRIRPDKRWNMNLVQKIVGTPMIPGPIDADLSIETHEDPHANLDDADRAKQDDDAPKGDSEDADEKSRAARRMMITQKDIDMYGETDGCPKCARYASGVKPGGVLHSEECRDRFYRMMEAGDHPKWKTIQGERKLKQSGPIESDNIKAADDDFADPVQSEYPEDWEETYDPTDYEDLPPDLDDDASDKEPADVELDDYDDNWMDDLMNDIDREEEPSRDFGMDVDMLVEMGVERDDAQRYMFKLTKASDQTTFH